MRDGLYFRISGHITYEDMASNAFLELYNNRHAAHGVNEAISFMYTSVKFFCFNLIDLAKVRKRHYDKVVLSQQQDSDIITLEKRELVKEIRQCINALPDYYKAFVVETYINDLTEEELSNMYPNEKLLRLQNLRSHGVKMIRDYIKMKSKPEVLKSFKELLDKDLSYTEIGRQLNFDRESISYISKFIPKKSIKIDYSTAEGKIKMKLFIDELTDQQRKISKLTMEGKSESEIGKLLGLTRPSIHNHRKAVIKKADIKFDFSKEKSPFDVSDKQTKEKATIEQILQALQATRNNKRAAARLLKVDVTIIYKKLKRLEQ